MTPNEIAQLIAETLNAIAAKTGEANLAVTAMQTQPERPKNREHGDWASNIALRYAKNCNTTPQELAKEISAKLAENPQIQRCEIAGPGFINITLSAASAGETAKQILQQGEKYGHNTTLTGQNINMEFVSANPTGPLHLGHTRWAALGDSIARLLRASGATVCSEYYINDAGAQMNKFGRSVLAAALNEQPPEDAYPGQYIQQLAAHANREIPELASLPREKALEKITEIAYRQQLQEIKNSLTRFNVHFDTFFSERSLHARNPENQETAITIALQRLKKAGHTYEKDGATWVRTTSFGDDKDRVFTRSDGEHTYFAADAAYYLNKKDRGFREKIYLLGADHHGYIGRLTAIAGAAGDNPKTDITVLIGQLVDLNGAKLSKRAGNIIELNDLLEWLGSDALRYWLARYPADSPLSLDGEKLRSRTNDNPVFYVQYAHARTRAVDRNCETAGIKRVEFAPQLLTHPSENDLLGCLQQYPAIVAGAAELREPHRIARYLEQLAQKYHRWYDNCRVLPAAKETPGTLHSTRLHLNDAAGQVLRNGLNLLGVNAPDRL